MPGAKQSAVGPAYQEFSQKHDALLSEAPLTLHTSHQLVMSQLPARGVQMSQNLPGTQDGGVWQDTTT